MAAAEAAGGGGSSLSGDPKLNVTLTQLGQRLEDARREVNRLLMELAEGGPHQLSWDDVVGRFSVLQAKIANIGRLLTSDNVPALNQHVVVPYQLTTVPSELLQIITEDRFKTFTHESAPHSLRTKLVPELERKDTQIREEAATLSTAEAKAQTDALNTACADALSAVTAKRRVFEARYSTSRAAPSVTPELAEAHSALITAVYSGEGLRASSGVL